MVTAQALSFDQDATRVIITWAASNRATLTEALPARTDSAAAIGLAGLITSGRQAEAGSNCLGGREAFRPVDSGAKGERHDCANTRQNAISRWQTGSCRAASRTRFSRMAS